MNGDNEVGSGTTNLGQGRRSWVKDKTQIHQNLKETKETKPKFSIPNKNSTRTIGFGWIGAGVRRSYRWCDQCDEGLRWCDWMGFLGLTNGFSGFDWMGFLGAIKWVWRMGFLGLGFFGLSGVGFWVHWSRSRFLGSSESESVFGFTISLLSLLSLSLRVWALSFSRSLSLLRVTRKWFKGKMKL